MCEFVYKEQPMNRLVRHTTWGLVAALAMGATARGQEYYSGYKDSPARGYRYSYYYFKIAGGFRYHYCTNSPGSPYVYYYDPQTQLFWGRYDLNAKGFSLLAPNDRKGNIRAIDPAAFPAPGPAMNNPATGDPLSTPPTPPSGPLTP
jgi:hypothetical protein